METGMHDGMAPDLDMLEQRDDVQPTAVAVRLDDSVKTHELPSRAGVMRTITLTTTPEPIAGRDLTRKRLHLHCYGPAAGMFVGTDRQSVADGSAYFLGQYGALDISHCEQVWARAADTSGQLAIMSELWAD